MTKVLVDNVRDFPGSPPHQPGRDRAVILIASLVGAVMLSGCGSSAPPAPVNYSTYVSDGGTFQIDYPADWAADGGGKRGLEWAKFTSGSIDVEVKTDVSGSLMGDIANAGAAGADPNDDLEPVDEVHETGKEEAKHDLDGYEEQGQPQKLVQSLGPGRYSEFTMPTAFGGVQRGLRATVLAHNKRVVVYCRCDDADWATIKPAFERMLTSLDRAGNAPSAVVAETTAGPEEVFHSYIDSFRNEGIVAALKYATPQLQAYTVYAMALGSVLSTQGGDVPPQVQQLFEKHGLDVHDELFTKQPTDMLAASQLFTDKVTDPMAFLDDFIAMGDEASGGELSKQMKQMGSMMAPEGLQIHDIQIDGDKATGVSEVTLGGNAISSPVAFQKINGEWRVDMSPEAAGGNAEVASTADGSSGATGAAGESIPTANDPFAADPGFGAGPGGGSEVGQGDAAATAGNLPEDVAEWGPNEIRAAFKAKNERLVEAIRQYSRKTVGDEAAAALFTELLLVPAKKEEPQADASGFDAGYGGGYGGGGYTDPQLGPELIAALGRNGTPPARKTLADLLGAKANAIVQDQLSLGPVVAALARNPSPENEDLLFAAATTPEKIRQEQQGMLAPDRMQAEVFKALETTASSELRKRLADFALGGAASDTTRQSIMRIVMAEQPENLAAQIVVFGKSGTDEATHDQLLTHFIELGNATIQDLLGIPVDFQLADIPGAPPLQGSGFLQPSVGSYGPDTTAYGAQATESAKDASQEARSRIAGAPVPSPDGGQGFGNDPYGNAGYSDAGGAAFGEQPATDADAVDTLRYYRVAGHLWSNGFVNMLQLDALDKAAVADGAQILRLASTMPVDAVRREIAKLVDQNWEMGAERMRSTPGPWGIDLKDPGALVIVKSQPRKMDPDLRNKRRSGEKEKPQGTTYNQAQRPAPRDKKEREDQAKYEWMEASEQFIRVWNQRLLAAARAGNHGQLSQVVPASGSPFRLAAARMNQAADEQGAEKKSDAAADPFGTRAADNAAEAATKLPVELHEGAKIVAEYHLNWPADLVGKMLGAEQFSPLVIHYVRIEESNRLSTLSKFYSGQMKGSRGNFLPDGRWLDFEDSGTAAGRRRTIDIMFTIPGYSEEAEKDDDEGKQHMSASAVQDLVVEILSVEINDPMKPNGA